MIKSKIEYLVESECYIFSINIVPKISFVNGQIEQENEYLVIYSTDGKTLEECKIHRLEYIQIIN